MAGNSRKVIVVGAGFSGLASAYYLSRAGFHVEVHEKQSKAGGLISTLQTEHGAVETAANGFLNSSLIEDLFRDIGCEMIGTKSEASKRYIFRSGEFRRWPLGFFGTLRVLWFIFQYFLFKEGVAPQEGESVRGWGNRVLGREASTYLFETGLQGIYAGDANRMSASLILNRFFYRISSNAPKRRLRFHGTVSAVNGMGEVIETLQKNLEARGVVFHFNSDFKPTSDVTIPVVVAGSAHQASQTLAGVLPEISKLLAQIEIAPVITATGFFDRTDANSQGFGVLFPSVERRLPLGVLKNNFIFRGRTKQLHSETWILGGATGDGKVFSASDRELQTMIEAERSSVFGIPEPARAMTITRWERAIPHYTVELEQLLPKIKTSESNVFLVGNYLGRIGLSKIIERLYELPLEIEAKGQWR